MFYGEQRRLEPEEGVAHDVLRKTIAAVLRLESGGEHPKKRRV